MSNVEESYKIFDLSIKIENRQLIRNKTFNNLTDNLLKL